MSIPATLASFTAPYLEKSSSKVLSLVYEKSTKTHKSEGLRKNNDIAFTSQAKLPTNNLVPVVSGAASDIFL